MDGGDVMEVEVYKKREEHWKEGSEKRERKLEGKTLKEESEQCIILCINGLLGRTCIKAFTYIFYHIKYFFLILILKRGPFLLFDPSSYKFIDLGQN